VGLLLSVVVLLATGCTPQVVGPLPDAPEPTTLEELEAILITSGVPSVVNVWASWCLPCRSEAPLIAEGSKAHPDVAFIGLNVKDTPQRARHFMAEYLADADMGHYADERGRIPADLGGGSGVPITFFFDSAGTLVATHRGIIDEPTLARFLDEIDR
jgi:cytochrome c biogenesis protein CcmG/thiol:disulfide interchange protein DsbE